MKQTRQQIQVYRAAWKKRLARNKKKLAIKKIELLGLARKCAKLLAETFPVTSVVLIGSLARDGVIHRFSDIDLVVTGLPDDKYFFSLKLLYSILPSDVELDLITFETTTEDFKQKTKMEGVWLL